ncbi:YjbQ family protein [Candidatus Curtissbacteria bacterium]|nr:YjbQ family protein [Candidatus Curtissbacteria bacterium]MBI2599230.1 YjbQ family protein [Candidatus Curtissbacteria bacterium]
MKAFLKEIKFPSTKHTYILDITGDINRAIKKTGVEQGFVFVNTKHTTLGILVNEIAEPNLLEDILAHTLAAVPEDKRSTRVSHDWKHPTKDYKHRCQDNPYCDEVDEDYNAAAHIRALAFSHPSVIVPIQDGKLDLGKYQEIAVFEFDGRDGKGKNPVRQRRVQVWICPAESITKI